MTERASQEQPAREELEWFVIYLIQISSST
jgi:hypothetical protein